MPASKAPGLTEAELQQRRGAPRKHGAMAFRDRGEEALNTRQRSRLQELKEQVETSEGVIDLLEDRAAHAVMLTELVTSYISQQVKSGKSIDRIPAVKYLPAYMNTAQRALKDLLAVRPDREGIIDAGEILEAIQNEQADSTLN